MQSDVNTHNEAIETVAAGTGVVFIPLTTPVTFMLLGRAALYRDRNGGDEDVPSADLGERS